MQDCLASGRMRRTVGHFRVQLERWRGRKFPEFVEVCRSLAAAALSAVAALALCVTMLSGTFAVFLTLFSLAESKNKDFYTFKVVNSRGKLVSLEKYRGSVSVDTTVRAGDS